MKISIEFREPNAEGKRALRLTYYAGSYLASVTSAAQTQQSPPRKAAGSTSDHSIWVSILNLRQFHRRPELTAEEVDQLLLEGARHNLKHKVRAKAAHH